MCWLDQSTMKIQINKKEKKTNDEIKYWYQQTQFLFQFSSVLEYFFFSSCVSRVCVSIFSIHFFQYFFFAFFSLLHFVHRNLVQVNWMRNWADLIWADCSLFTVFCWCYEKETFPLEWFTKAFYNFIKMKTL